MKVLSVVAQSLDNSSPDIIYHSLRRTDDTETQEREVAYGYIMEISDKGKLVFQDRSNVKVWEYDKKHIKKYLISMPTKETDFLNRKSSISLAFEINHQEDITKIKDDILSTLKEIAKDINRNLDEFALKEFGDNYNNIFIKKAKESVGALIIGLIIVASLFYLWFRK